MKGLIIKDFKLFLSQGRFFFVVIFISILMTFTTKSIGFLSGYMIVILPMFASSSISYDEFDNGNPFLFTLPFRRSTYAVEKYVFCVLLGLFAFALALVFSAAASFFVTVNMLELFLGSLGSLAATLALQSVLIPLQLKFGGEKSRIILIAVVGGVLALGFIAIKILPMLGFDLAAFWGAAEAAGTGLVISIAAAALAVIVSASILISTAIVKKKEF